MSNTAKARRLGRPKLDSGRTRLVHVRLTDELADRLEGVRRSRLDRPDISSLVREALAEFVQKEEGRK